uniref:Ubiquitin-protein ligase, putative n=1 Tax=Arundo donax TaxID=35708 RepID=A0A0A9CKE0_ARUDO
MLPESRVKVLPNFRTCQFQSLLPSEEFLDLRGGGVLEP